MPRLRVCQVEEPTERISIVREPADARRSLLWLRRCAPHRAAALHSFLLSFAATVLPLLNALSTVASALLLPLPLPLPPTAASLAASALTPSSRHGRSHRPSAFALLPQYRSPRSAPSRHRRSRCHPSPPHMVAAPRHAPATAARVLRTFGTWATLSLSAAHSFACAMWAPRRGCRKAPARCCLSSV